MALTKQQQQEVQDLLTDIDRLSSLLAAERLHLADLEAAEAGS